MAEGLTGAPCAQIIDGIPFVLQAPFDFSFLHEYGRVFKVFDDQDSGNICFGVENNGERYFIKFAGALPARYFGAPTDAVARLRAALPLYRALRHPALIELVSAREVGGGLACAFQWARGECMGRMYPEARRRFMAADLSTRRSVFRDVLSFFAYVAAAGYVAIDFYDGSILYDFESGKTTICDIDFFRKSPAVNDRGRMWGSSRFMSPEEFAPGAPLDEVTNVYTLGATAFALFSDFDRSAACWPLGERAYRTALRAVSDKRTERQRSIREFAAEWEAALA